MDYYISNDQGGTIYCITRKPLDIFAIARDFDTVRYLGGKERLSPEAVNYVQKIPRNARRVDPEEVNG